MKKIVNKFIKGNNKKVTTEQLIQEFVTNGKVPWSPGYWPYKMRLISELIGNPEKLNYFRNKSLPNNFALGIDERIIEYGWFFSKINSKNLRILDAGSVLNFPEFVENNLLQSQNLHIITLAPEKLYFNAKGISYIYEDLRDIPIRDNYYDVVVSISTIEHIDMDNEVFGVKENNNKNVVEKKYGYIKACLEMLRVIKKNGDLFLTFPYGKWKNYGFFQQFDREMVQKIKDELKKGAEILEESYFKYDRDGWKYSKPEELINSLSFNPHTGEDKGEDGAAHCRGICCLHFKKI